jgi:hypothetical protein
MFAPVSASAKTKPSESDIEVITSPPGNPPRTPNEAPSPPFAKNGACCMMLFQRPTRYTPVEHLWLHLPEQAALSGGSHWRHPCPLFSHDDPLYPNSQRRLVCAEDMPVTRKRQNRRGIQLGECMARNLKPIFPWSLCRQQGTKNYQAWAVLIPRWQGPLGVQAAV